MEKLVTRLFHVIVVRNRDGAKEYMTSTPLNHDEACTVLSKITRHKWRSEQLEPAGEYEVGQRFEFRQGDAVVCNGYPGTIYRVETGTLERMVTVRLRSGLTTVEASYPTVYPNTKF
jgi:hypothetical protein